MAQHTFLFADLAGFTALTEAHGDQQAAEVAAEFATAARALLASHQARELKAIGDALMILAREPAAAIQLGLAIVHDVGGQHGFPAVRVGMNTGDAVEQDGDWFGSTVNIAARVSGVASGGDVLLTAATKAAAGRLHGIKLYERGRRALKNIGEPMLLYEAIREGERDVFQRPIDPVCRMAVDPDHSAGRLRYQGIEFHFCSLHCAAAFAANPSTYSRSDN